ncbi:MAG: hypothetical protein MZV63_50445 [Marinilabiliales bacterium]|nr:hypothetical protein [Marinilabiliales bacterium]
MQRRQPVSTASTVLPVKGNHYLHDTLNIIRENGNLVYLYIADEELREAWNEEEQPGL